MTTPGAAAKWTVTAAVCAAVAVHILMTLTYLSPPNLLRRALGMTADRYMGALFYQNWHLFSPTPGITSTKVAVRCGDGSGTWTNYFDPLENLYAAHYRTRVLGYGKVLYVYREIGTALKGEVDGRRAECLRTLRVGEAVARCAPEQLVPLLPDSPAYQLARRFAADTCSRAGTPSAEVQFKIIEFFPLKYSERGKIQRRWSHVDELVFPSFRSAIARER